MTKIQHHYGIEISSVNIFKCGFQVELPFLVVIVFYLLQFRNTHTYTHTYTHKYIHSIHHTHNMYIHINTYTLHTTHTYMHIHINTYTLHTHTHIHAYTYKHIHTTHHTHIHVYTHIHIHVYTHTYTVIKSHFGSPKVQKINTIHRLEC